MSGRNFLLIFMTIFVLLLGYPSACLSAGIPATGDLFPSEDLKIPDDEVYISYLGLDGSKDTFKLQDIKADLAVVQIFSMYCPVCQREAEEVNNLFWLMEQRAVDDKVKLIGIAPGNSDFEVSVFREQYDIPFPLIADADYEWHKIMGEVGTPYFLLVNLENRIILEDSLGPFGTSQDYFELIMKHLQ